MDLLPVGLVVAKLALDALLMLLFVLGKGSTRNRLRTTLSYATLFALLSVSQGWSNALITPAAVSGLLWVSITVSATIALRNLGVLRSRRIADALSVANLLCGGIGMYFAAEGKLGVSLLMLCLGAALDGLDGAAARRCSSCTPCSP